MRTLSFITLVLAILTSCSSEKSFSGFSDYRSWLTDPGNGLVKTKTVNGIAYEVKYIPPEYLAYVELKDKENVSPVLRDSVVESYRRNLNFVLKIGPSSSDEGDIMLRTGSDVQSFTDRVSQFNFGLESFIWLQHGKTVQTPILARLENTYGLTLHRNILITFPSSALGSNASTFQFVYHDQHFATGINKFEFELASIINTPNLNF